MEVAWSEIGKLLACELPLGMMLPLCYLPRPYDQTCVPGLLNTLVQLEYLDYTNVAGSVNYFKLVGRKNLTVLHF